MKFAPQIACGIGLIFLAGSCSLSLIFGKYQDSVEYPLRNVRTVAMKSSDWASNSPMLTSRTLLLVRKLKRLTKNASGLANSLSFRYW